MNRIVIIFLLIVCFVSINSQVECFDASFSTQIDERLKAILNINISRDTLMNYELNILDLENESIVVRCKNNAIDKNYNLLGNVEIIDIGEQSFPARQYIDYDNGFYFYHVKHGFELILLQYVDDNKLLKFNINDMNLNLDSILKEELIFKKIE